MLVQSQIVAILNELLSQSARMRKGGDQATYFCPFCNHVKRKLEICLEEGPDFSKWHCWTCNAKGKYLGSLLNKLKAPKSYREKLVALTGDLRLTRRSQTLIAEPELSLPEEFLPLSRKTTSIEYRNAITYLRGRGIEMVDIIRYNIGYCEEGDYVYHVIIPSYDASGKLNFFMGRRYYDSEGVVPHKKPEASMNIVGFEHFVNYSEPLNLCEGIFDSIAIRNNAIPLFGKYPSKKLREKMILNGVKRVNIVLDNDALNDAVKNYELLIRNVPGIEVFIVKLNGKDPSQLGFLKVHELIREAEEFTESDLFAYKLGL
jgi:hypothetical protein